MNKLTGTIRKVESADNLSIVDVESGGMTVSCIVIDTAESDPYLKPGNSIELLFKETEVSIGKELSGGLSTRNRFPCLIRGIEEGKLLARLVLDFRGSTVVSVITTRACRALNLREGDSVEALVKVNEISLMEPPQ